MPPKDKYTDPELRDQVKEEIHESDKGGAPGQWSARKAQMMASEYKKRGGGYTTDKDQGQDESQKNLQKWGEEEWQTKEGSGNAKQEDGTEKRYLPKKAWEQMSEEEKQATDEKKQDESKEGKQFVGNTQKAKNARQKANENETEEFENRKQSKKSGSKSGKSNGANADEKEDGVEDDADAAEEEGYDYDEAQDGEYKDDEIDDDDGEGEEENEVVGEGDEEDADVADESDKAPRGQKRGRKNQGGGSSKKRKDNSGQGKQNGTVGSKQDPAEAPAPAGSKDRVPKEGQKVVWKSLPGYVDGEVIEVLYDEKEVDGKKVKAKKNDPRIVLKSSSSGKICVHKPDAIYFDD
ncbi:MAG: hypothetical protein M1822_000100 [Bathelium mastoideum]|nr:MAG: hypothetical protein M1822_000100 [Bathelium mastoideum]